MKLFAVLLLIFGINGQLQAAIDAVYEGSNGIRNQVLTVCMQCHSSSVTGAARNGAPSPPNFNLYADAFLFGDYAVARAVDGSMPPQGRPRLTAEQKTALLAWQAAGFPEKPAAVPDTQAPTTPAGLTATTVSNSAIHLAWTASTDDVGVTAYKVYRDGSLIATLGTEASYDDRGLGAATAYSYGVTACDAAGNCSAPSASAAAATQQQSDCLFNWAETGFPDFFAPHVQSQSAGPYYYRFYPPGSYLAIASNQLLYLGPLSNNTVLQLGDVVTWYARSGCN